MEAPIQMWRKSRGGTVLTKDSSRAEDGEEKNGCESEKGDAGIKVC